MSDDRRLRLVTLSCFSLFGGLLTQQVLAADDAASAGTLTEVVVTGSRIALPNQTSTSPIQVVTEKDIQVGGRNDISDVILQLPQNFNNSFSDFSNRTSGLSTPGGITTADLRGLGPSRTLVLINGRRLGPGDSNTANPNPAPDLDQIPTSLVERVDVVTGGASSVYGSDAIAGVINFVMKRNFEGIQIDGQIGENWHTQHSDAAKALLQDAGYDVPSGSVYDGRNRTFNLVVGTNIADGKGNLTAYFGFLKAAPVPSGNRDFGACQLNANPDDSGKYTGATCFGTSNSNLFQVNGVGTQYSVLGNQFVTRGSVATNPPAIYNSQPLIYVGRDNLRYSAGFLAHIDVNDHIKPYAEFGFMNDRTTQDIAPSGLFRSSNPLDPSGKGNYNINCSNPFLSAQQAGILCSPADIAADAADPGSVSSNVQIGRRNVEGGGRESYYEHTNYRAVVGITGELFPAWTYDAYGQYYYTQFFQNNQRYFSFQSITNALQVTRDASGQPVCISGAPCVPLNIFADGGITQQALQYEYLNGTSYGVNTERIIHADITGDLGTYGFKSPLAEDGFSVNIGFEHRGEQLGYDPDSGELSGLLSGFGGAAGSIHQSYSVKEGFIEFGGPVVQDEPGVKALIFDAGFRHSDYSTSGGVNTGKFEVQYAPIDDIRLRASYQRAIRAPNLIDLYNPATVGQINSGDDPCAPNEVTGNLNASLAQCARSGVTAQQYNDASVPQGSGSQLSELIGGNINLKPERATSYSFGMNITPLAMPNLIASIDYFQIEIKDEIGAIPPGLLLAGCLNTGTPFFCDKIVRNPADGGLTGFSQASGGYIVQTGLNIGGAKVSGIDLQTVYKLPFDALGSLTFSLNGSYLLKSETTPYPGGPSYDCAGLYGSLCATVNPKWRHTVRATWAMPWNLDVSATWRFIGSVKLDNNDSNPVLFGRTFTDPNTGGPAINYYNARVGSYSYLDLSASWQVFSALQLRAGINNILDKDPPLITSEIVAGGAANTFETYDTLGRQLFVAFTAKF